MDIRIAPLAEGTVRVVDGFPLFASFLSVGVVIVVTVVTVVVLETV